MYDGGGKKNLNLLILEVLKDYSDEEHALTQQRVLQLLKENYGVVCDRRSVRNNIDCLIEYGFDIDTEKGYRLMSRTFDDAELQMLINSVVFSKFLTKAQAKQLIDKLVDESSRHFKLSFIYNRYGTDRRMHPRRKEPYIYNPYQIVMSNGNFYLVGNYDKYDTISHFRIDKMTNMKILDEERKPAREVKGMEHGLDLPKHMAEHVYMFSGESVTVLLRTSQRSMDML